MNLNHAPYEGQIGDCGDVTDIPGCMDESALNYNSDATVDDGSCEYDNSCICPEVYQPMVSLILIHVLLSVMV